MITLDAAPTPNGWMAPVTRVRAAIDRDEQASRRLFEPLDRRLAESPGRGRATSSASPTSRAGTR